MGSKDNNLINVLFGTFLVLNISFLGVRFYKLLKDQKDKKPCKCQEKSSAK